MKLRSFISRLQELNAYLEEFPPDTEGQETGSLPADEILDIIYHSMPTTWKNKMIEQGFNYADSTIKEMSDFFETEVEISFAAFLFSVLETCFFFLYSEIS